MSFTAINNGNIGAGAMPPGGQSLPVWEPAHIPVDPVYNPTLQRRPPPPPPKQTAGKPTGGMVYVVCPPHEIDNRLGGSASALKSALSGIGSGAGLGATVGSIFPGAGTAIGTAIGSVLGLGESIFGHHSKPPIFDEVLINQWKDIFIKAFPNDDIKQKNLQSLRVERPFILSNKYRYDDMQKLVKKLAAAIISNLDHNEKGAAGVVDALQKIRLVRGFPGTGGNAPRIIFAFPELTSNPKAAANVQGHGIPAQTKSKSTVIALAAAAAAAFLIG